MNFKDFGTQLDRLKEVYGDRAYPEARIKLIYNWSRRLNVEAFEAVVSKLIGECDRTPLLGKFKEAYAEIRSTLPRSTVDCIYCQGSGVILSGKAPELGTGYACKCAMGEMIPKFVARWQGPWERCSPPPELIMRTKSAEIVQKTFENKGAIK